MATPASGRPAMETIVGSTDKKKIEQNTFLIHREPQDNSYCEPMSGSETTTAASSFGAANCPGTDGLSAVIRRISRMRETGRPGAIFTRSGVAAGP